MLVCSRGTDYPIFLKNVSCLRKKKKSLFHSIYIITDMALLRFPDCPHPSCAFCNAPSSSRTGAMVSFIFCASLSLLLLFISLFILQVFN